MVWETMVAKLVREATPLCENAGCRETIRTLPLQVEPLEGKLVRLCDDVIAVGFIDGKRSSINRRTRDAEERGDRSPSGPRWVGHRVTRPPPHPIPNTHAE